MAILIWIIFGAVAGAAARHVMPGPAAGGIPVAVGLGIAGALIGGLAGTFIGGSFASFDVYSLLMAIFASLLVLLGYRSYAMRAIA